jgi:hypothetical protein
MNAPARLFERDALIAAEHHAASNDALFPHRRNPTARRVDALPFGFQDDAGNTVLLVDQSRQYHVDARKLGHLSDEPVPEATAAGRAMAAEAVRAARQASAKFEPAAGINSRNSQLTIGRRSWHETPVKYRRIICHLACLPSDVADKMDRDLTESEKVLLRAAARDLYDGIRGTAEAL